MKILCLQLARYGDIYQTWPALNALRRQWPDAQIDLLVRERFRDATVGLEAIDRVLFLPTKEILAPIFQPRARADDSLFALDRWVRSIAQTKYDRICNLSFSPVSSYLTDILAGNETLVTGYSRFSDGFLNIVDDASSYFYAQVGTERTNRIHLADLFALVAGADLIDADIFAPETEWPTSLPKPANEFVVLHTGASIAAKRCPATCWQQMIDEILDRTAFDVVVVGVVGEDECLSQAQRENGRVYNFVGQTRLPELFAPISAAKLVVAGDSVAVHMASLTHTPTLNISFACVRFWETGPRAKDSRVVWFETPEQADASVIVEEACALLDGRRTNRAIILKNETFGVLYSLIGYEEDSFAWELTRALYMSQSFPTTDDARVAHAFQRIKELAGLGLEQIRVIEAGEAKTTSLATSILDQVDHLLRQIENLVPSVAPVVRWFLAEKCRIAPGEVTSILASTRSLLHKLSDISQLYSINQKMNDSLKRESLTWKS